MSAAKVLSESPIVEKDGAGGQFPISVHRSDNTQTATILINTTTSTSIDIHWGTWVGIVLPTMTGATVTFQASVDGGSTWFAVYDENSVLVTLTMVSGTNGYNLPVGVMPYSLIRLVSASSEASARAVLIAQKS